MEKAIELEYKNRRIDGLTEAKEKLEQEMAESLQDCSLDRFHTQLETSVRENQSRIQELVIKLDRQKEQEKKAVAKLKYELQLARESQERAESKAAEVEAAAAALRCQLEEAVKQGEANRQVVVSFRLFIAAGSFSPSKSE
jgi:chromosome segregation ATPase